MWGSSQKRGVRTPQTPPPRSAYAGACTSTVFCFWSHVIMAVGQCLFVFVCPVHWVRTTGNYPGKLLQIISSDNVLPFGLSERATKKHKETLVIRRDNVWPRTMENTSIVYYSVIQCMYFSEWSGALLQLVRLDLVIIDNSWIWQHGIDVIVNDVRMFPMQIKLMKRAI